MKTFLTFLSATCFTLFGLQQVGGKPIAPGHDTHFSWKTLGPAWRVVVAWTEDADLKCILRLLVRPSSNPGPAWTAVLGDTDTLAVTARLDDVGASWLEISARDSAGRPAGRFDWPSGSRLVLSPPSGMSLPLVVNDWEIYSASHGLDSRSLERRRTIAFTVSLVLLVLSLVIAGVAAAWPAHEEQEPLTPERCILITIKRIEGKTRKDTRRMHKFLRKVLVERSPLMSTLDTLGLTFFQSRKLLRDSTTEFFTRFDALVAGLGSYQQQLHRHVGV